MSDKIKIVAHRFQNHKSETDGFRFNYMTASDEAILGLTNVFPETIQCLSNDVIKIVTPKHRAQLRKDIAYLIGLQERQKVAWTNYLNDCEQRLQNTLQWIRANQR